jgi:hypothetical protein
MLKKKYRFVYDVECYPNLFSVKLKNIESKEIFTFTSYHDRLDDKLSINQIAEFIDFIEKKVQWLIGYNNSEYDDLLVTNIMSYASRLRNSHARKITEECYALSNDIFSYQYQDKKAPQVYALQRIKKSWKSLDLMLLFNPQERVSLKQLAISLRWSRIQDLPIAPGTILTRPMLEKLDSYHLNDVLMTEAVMLSLQEDINNRILYTVKFGTDVINSSNSAIGKTLLAGLYEKATGIPYEQFKDQQTNYTKLPLADCVSPRIIFRDKYMNKLLTRVKEKVIDPNLKEKQKIGRKRPQFAEIVRSKYLTHNMMLGGVHSNNVPEILEEDDQHLYIDIDVRGYYPRIWCEEKLYPKHLDPIITKLLEQEILNPRDIIKKSDPVLAYMLKIGANAAFGLTDVKGDAKSWLKDPRVAKYITISGQLFLFMLMEALEAKTKCLVVYSNTDGLTVRVPRSEEFKFNLVCSRWENYTHFVLEKVYYRKMIIRDVNNYLMFTHAKSEDDRIKSKGAYKWKRALHESFVYPVISTAVREWFDIGCPVEFTILFWQHIKKEKAIYDFMKAERTNTKDFDVILYPKDQTKAPEKLQKNIRWIVTKNNPLEGRLVKIKKDTQERTEMQKGFFVTVTNDVDESLSIESYSLNYEFYINQAKAMINITKPIGKETHLAQTEQLSIFEF